MTVSGQAIFEAEYVSFANERHGDQKYGNVPYLHHLIDVTNVLEDFGFTSYKYRAAGYLHDVLEDTETTSGEIIKGFGVEVAELVIACTGEGNNRKQRQENILHKLRYCPEACVVKVADRISNIRASIREHRRDKFDMYKAEYKAFREVVEKHVPEEMLKCLDELMATYDND